MGDMIWVEDVTTGERLLRWPVDAREMIALGVCRPAEDAADAVARGMAAFPLLGKARSTVSPMTPELTAPTVLADVTEKPKKGK